MDSFLYDETIESNDVVEQMINKQVLYVLDQNGGSYNGQIQFDTSTLSNSGRWLAYSEGYLEVPFQITLKSSTNLTAANAYVNGFMVGLKNGYHQLIDSIQVDYNNKNVVQLQPFTNFFVSYKLMSTFSADDLRKYGPSIGFWPDSPASMSFSAGASANGDGTSNNVANPVASINYNTQLETFNLGYLKRLQSTSYSLNNSGTVGYGGNAQINSVGLANQIGKNYQTDDNGAGAARVWTWNILATIRLKDLCDFFDKIPLVKGAFMRFTINYNSATMDITTTTVAGPPLVNTMVSSALTMSSGRTNPLLVASASAGNPSFGSVTNGAGGKFTVSCGVARALNSSIAGLMSSCRLYVPAYKLNPKYEEQLFALTPFREVVYEDIYNYNIVNIGPGQSFNTILTNGIVNPQYVLIMPFLNGTSANNGIALNIPSYQSMFDSAPGTTSPLAAITNFNIQVAGENLFQQNFQYDFETFINETSSLNAINGGASTSLTNGLIGHLEFENGYRYYVGNTSRRIESENSVPKSIVVQGQNNTSKAMDYICFIVFKRKITIDMKSGEIIENKV